MKNSLPPGIPIIAGNEKINVKRSATVTMGRHGIAAYHQERQGWLFMCDFKIILNVHRCECNAVLLRGQFGMSASRLIPQMQHPIILHSLRRRKIAIPI